MCLPFSSIFDYCFPKKLSNEEIQQKRINILPFTWKYRIAPYSTLETNLEKTKKISEKSENLASSSKQFRDMTKKLNNC